MEKTEEIKKLAETLKNSGLASSMYEAMGKAKDILEHSNQGETKKKTEEPAETKVDRIIEEVDTEIKEKKNKSEEQAAVSQSDKSEPADPSFNISESNKTLNELSPDEIMTNDPHILEKEKQAMAQDAEGLAESFEQSIDNSKYEKSEVSDSENLQSKEPEESAKSAVTDSATATQDTSESQTIVRTNDELELSKNPQQDIIEESASDEPKAEESEEKRPTLTDEEKEAADLSKIFNFSKK